MARELPLGAVLKAAAVAGLAAGLLVAAFHFVVTEPHIDRAIALEEQLHQEEAGHDESPVSRDVQRGGLVVGFLLYGLTWALLLGLIYHALQRRLPSTDGLKQGLLLALAGYWSVGLLPFLKYPASPPGVGDPETIAYRQGLYLGFLGLSVGATLVALGLGEYAGRRARSALGRWPATLASLGFLSALVYLAMPSNPDQVQMPADVVASFRTASLLGLSLFWATLGLAFGLLLRRAGREPAVRGGAVHSPSPSGRGSG